MTVRLPSSLAADTPAEPSYNLPKPGDVVANKYRIDRLLGRGGMGAVFAVTHTVTHKRLAIKWLLTGLESDEQVKRFVRESQVAGRVEHPNLVEVYDICREATGIFMVMELLKGEALSVHLERLGRLAVRDACTIMLACMDGLAAAHRAGVVHRDIKPANIFLHTAHGVLVPKLLDFGISRLSTGPEETTASTTRSGVVLGTPLYMAPEQLRCESSDERVDVYALGVTLYELLAGKRPFQGGSYPDLVLRIVAGAAQPLAAVREDIPYDLSAVIARAMSVDAAKRFSSVEAFAAALRPFGETSVTGAINVQTIAGSRRSRRQAALIGTLLIALLVSLGLLWRVTTQVSSSDERATPHATPTAGIQTAPQGSDAPRAGPNKTGDATSTRETQDVRLGKNESESQSEWPPNAANPADAKSGTGAARRWQSHSTTKPEIAGNVPPKRKRTKAPAENTTPDTVVSPPVLPPPAKIQDPRPARPDLTLSPETF